MLIPPTSQPGQTTDLLISTKMPLALRVGEVLEAEVLNVTETSVAIRMKNTILEAQSNIPLRQGETIMVRVEGTGNEVRLRLAPGGEGDLASIKDTILSALNNLKGLKPAAEDLKALQAFIKAMPDALPEMKTIGRLLPSLEGLSGNSLRNAIQGSGVLFETKLRLLVQGQEGAQLAALFEGTANADLKAALLSLKESLGKSDVVNRLLQSGVNVDALASSADNLLKNIEFLQLQSTLNDTLQVFVPFVWQDLKDGEVIFRESGREREGEPSYSCAIYLDLERAGRISARVLFQAGSIHANVLAENKRLYGLLRDNAGILKEQFATAGLKLGGLSIQHEKTIDFRTSRPGGLNIRI